MTIDEAKKALVKQYTDAGQIPHPLIGVQVGTAPAATGGGPCLNIYINRTNSWFRPPESALGVGYQGFQCVAYLVGVVADSGPIP